MKVVNFWGGPGSGKSTLALALTAEAKFRGINAEFVPEVAREMILERGKGCDLSNQFYISAMQYTRLKNLHKAGCELAVVDSPLIQQMIYASEYKVPYTQELWDVIDIANKDFANIDVFVNRVKPYSTFGRVQAEEEAKKIDDKIKKCFGFDLFVSGDRNGLNEVSQFIFKEQ